MTEIDPRAAAAAHDLMTEINAEAEQLLTFSATMNPDVAAVAADPEYRGLMLAGAQLGTTAALTVLQRRGLLP